MFEHIMQPAVSIGYVKYQCYQPFKKAKSKITITATKNIKLIISKNIRQTEV